MFSFSSVVIILRTLYISVSCLFLLIITTFTLPWRFFVYIVAKTFRPELKCFVTGISRLFCSTVQWGDILPINTMTVLTVKGNVDLEALRHVFLQRVLQKRDRRGDLIFGKFYETITYFMGYPFWMREKNFDLTKHIELYDYHQEGIKSFDEDCLKTYLSKLMNKPWEGQRSYWHVTVVHDYNDKDQTIMILKWQHVLGDGFSMKKVLEALSSPENVPAVSTENLTKSSTIHQRLQILWKAVKSLALFPYESARFKLKAATNETHLWLKDTNIREDQYNLTFTKPFPVEDIKSIQAKYSVGFQTVIFSSVSAAMEKALKQFDQPITEMVLSDYSKPIFPHPEGMTNSFYFGLICAPLTATSTADRLIKSEKSFRAHRRSNVPFGLYYVVEIGALLPGSLPWICINFLFQFIHMIFTSFPYFGELSFEGYNVTDMFTLFGAPHPTADFTAVVTGAPNQVRVGLSFRKNVSSLPAKTVDLIRQYIEEELEQLYKSSE